MESKHFFLPFGAALAAITMIVLMKENVAEMVAASRATEGRVDGHLSPLMTATATGAT